MPLVNELWICGDSNSSGLALRLVPHVTAYKPSWLVVNQAIPTENSITGTARVMDSFDIAPEKPALAFLCWGAADALQEFAFVYPTEAALLGMAPLIEEASRAGSAGRMIALARHMSAEGTTVIIARGVGSFYNTPHPDDTNWYNKPPEVQNARTVLAGWLDTAYKQIMDTCIAEDMRFMTDENGANEGYDLPQDPIYWLPDYLHASAKGLDEMVCRVFSYLNREGLW